MPPSRTASTMKRYGDPSRIPTSSTTAATATKTISMIQGSLGSFLRVRSNACRIIPAWLVMRLIRPTFGSPDLPVFACVAPLAAAELRPRPPSFGVRPALPLGAVDSVGLLRAIPPSLRTRCPPPLASSRRAPAAGRESSDGGRESARGDRLLVEPAGAVGAAHQRTGQHTGEPDALGLGGEADELLRLDPADDRVVPGGGAQVLGDREQVAAGVVQRLHRLDHLVRLLAHAQDEVGLG